MSASSSPSGTDPGSPRLGILVDCQRARPKACRVKRAPLPPPLAIPLGPAVRSRSWRVPAALTALGLLFLVSMTVGFACRWLNSPTPSPAPVAVAPVLPGGPPAPPKQHVVAAAAAKPKAKPVEANSPRDVSPPAGPAPAPLSAPPPEPKAAVEEPATPAPEVAVAPKETAKPAADTSSTGTCKATGDGFGTAVAFAASPTLAGEQAFKEHKLLFVLHVSGNFEDPGFT